MSVGQKKAGPRPLACLRALRANQGGFTIIEALLCTLFITIIFSALFLTLNIGQLSSPANAAKIELRDNLRRLLDWITRDVRNTSRGEIAANNPSADYIKFRQVQGMDTQTGYYILSSDYIEYAYNSIDQKITRNLLDSSGNVLQSWEFGGITQSPFYTRDSLGALVVLSQGLLLNSGILIVDIRAEKQVCEVRINQNCLNLTLALSGEIKIRNE